MMMKLKSFKVKLNRELFNYSKLWFKHKRKGLYQSTVIKNKEKHILCKFCFESDRRFC